MLVGSTVMGALAGLVGMYLSYWLDVSSGATIVLLEAGIFIVVFAATTVSRRRTSWAEQRIPVLATDRPADDLG
jgi:ABC-type Mn2+/Zn2+ transport system permease subunit